MAEEQRQIKWRRIFQKFYLVSRTWAWARGARNIRHYERTGLHLLSRITEVRNQEAHSTQRTQTECGVNRDTNTQKLWKKHFRLNVATERGPRVHCALRQTLENPWERHRLVYNLSKFYTHTHTHTPKRKHPVIVYSNFSERNATCQLPSALTRCDACLGVHCLCTWYRMSQIISFPFCYL